jgi:hypothetical protein
VLTGHQTHELLMESVNELANIHLSKQKALMEQQRCIIIRKVR